MGLLAAGWIRGAVPSQHGWKRDAMVVYQVNVESAEPEYFPSLRGPVVYLCRAANPHGYTLRCYNQAAIQRHAKGGRRFPPFGVFQFGWRFFDGKSVGSVWRAPQDVVFRPNGEILLRSGSVRVLDLQDPSLLVLDRLGPENLEEWTVKESVQIQHEARSAPAGVDRLVRIIKTPVEATLIIHYRRTASGLGHECLLKTAPSTEGVHLKLAGRGVTQFAAVGLPKSMNWKGQLTEQLGASLRVVPVNISHRRMSTVEADQVLRPPAPVTRAERRQLEKKDLELILPDLRQRFSNARPQALERLVTGEPRTVPEGFHPKVVAALTELLRDTDPFIRRDAARALANWGTAEVVPALAAALNDRQMTVRWAAVDALGSLRDPQGLEPLIQHMAAGREMAAVTNALMFYGRARPGLETHLLPLLSSDRPEVRLETSKLLTQFGTPRSLAQLSQLTRDADPEVAKASMEAIKAVRKRIPLIQPRRRV